MRRLRWPWALAWLTSWSLGCGGDETTMPLDATLGDGTRIEVNDAGVTLSLDGRVLLATASGEAITARSFDETFTSTVGVWIFTRDDEQATALSSYQGAEQTGDAVTASFASGDGSASAKLRVEPAADYEATRMTWTVQGVANLGSVAVPVACDQAASFHGFGEQYNGTDQRGEAFELLVTEQGIGRDPDLPAGGLNGGPHTTYFPMPYWLDARGHGVLFETSRRVDVDLCSEDEGVAWVEVVAGAPLELLVFHGPTPAEVIRQLSLRVGRPSTPPSWAYSLWVGAQGGRDAVLAEADALEAAMIPAGALWVQDWTGQRPNLDGGSGVQYRWLADEELYPDLAGMIDELHSRGYRFLSYANPFIDPALEHYPEMDAQGLLIQTQTGITYDHLAPNLSASHADLSNEAARTYIKDHLRAMVVDLGMDGWMSDFGEWVPLDTQPSDGSDPIAFHNEYPIAWHRLWREVMDEERPDGDFAVFARSGFTGVQAVSQIHWVGDQEANWGPHDGLPTVVPAMLNLGLSGVPFVTHDIAGFSGGPSSKELWQRWVELGAFTPIMRTHEGNNKDDNWSWEKDPETTDHFRRFTLVHQALAPDFETWAEEAAASSMPIVRHMMLVFPDDPTSATVDDQFMLGDALLVAPVMVQGATDKSVYLPPGTWFDVWTGESIAGGQRIDVPAAIGTPPVFSRGVDRSDLRAIP
jgi:sulfoquinovosidase